MASGKVASAKAEADAEAGRIKAKGESDLKEFESSIAKKKGKAAEVVVSHLLGESR